MSFVWVAKGDQTNVLRVGVETNPTVLASDAASTVQWEIKRAWVGQVCLLLHVTAQVHLADEGA